MNEARMGVNERRESGGPERTVMKMYDKHRHIQLRSKTYVMPYLRSNDRLAFLQKKLVRILRTNIQKVWYRLIQWIYGKRISSCYNASWLFWLLIIIFFIFARDRSLNITISWLEASSISSCTSICGRLEAALRRGFNQILAWYICGDRPIGAADDILPGPRHSIRRCLKVAGWGSFYPYWFAVPL